MSGTLEFFYDYVSTYSYLANSQLGRIDAEVKYRPMFLGGVLKATGNRAPLTVPIKFKYLNHDVARWVDRYEIPFNMNPNFPQNTVKALRLALVAMHKGRFDEVHQALFNAMWVDQQDLSDDAVLAQIAGNAGLSAKETLAEIATDAIKDELRANTDEAIDRGVFGAPTLFVGDEMFFGNDRFDFIEAALENQRF